MKYSIYKIYTLYYIWHVLIKYQHYLKNKIKNSHAIYLQHVFLLINQGKSVNIEEKKKFN